MSRSVAESQAITVTYSEHAGISAPVVGRRQQAGSRVPRAVRVVAAPATEQASAAEIAVTLRESVAIAHRLRALGDRLGVHVEDVLAGLVALTTAIPAGVEHPAAALPAHDEAVLREAGSLDCSLPPFAERASTATAVATLALLSGALTVPQAAERLGVTPGRVRQRIAPGVRSLFAVDAGGRRLLPAFQFTEAGAVPGLDRVLPALPPDVHPLVVFRFLTRPDPDLDVDGEPTTPLAWLSGGGDTARVVAMARELHTVP